MGSSERAVLAKSTRQDLDRWQAVSNASICGKPHNSTAQILLFVFLNIVVVLALFRGFCKLFGFHALFLQSIGIQGSMTVAVDCYCFVKFTSEPQRAAKPLKPAKV